MILEQDVENRDSRQHGIEDGLAVLRRLHEIRGARRDGGEYNSEQEDADLPESSPKTAPKLTPRD